MPKITNWPVRALQMEKERDALRKELKNRDAAIAMLQEEVRDLRAENKGLAMENLDIEFNIKRMITRSK